MHEYIIALRLIHIITGVMWAGGMFTFALFIVPAVNASGPEGGKVMGQIAATNHYPVTMPIIATLNIISGLLLLWQISNGLNMDFILSPHGMALTIGGTIAIIAYTIGMSISRPGAARMAHIGHEIAAESGKPSESQLAELAHLRHKITVATKYIAWLLLITVALMAVARYLY